jgi:hypothetical protein
MRFILLSVLIILPNIGCDTLLCQDLYAISTHSELTLNRQSSSKACAICDSVYDTILTIPQIIVSRIEGTFKDDVIQRELTGCIIVISGSWKELSGKASPGDLIFKFLSEKGWMEEVKYSADGPDGTSFALSKDEILCSVRGQWDSGDDADSTYVASDIYQFIVKCAECGYK